MGGVLEDRSSRRILGFFWRYFGNIFCVGLWAVQYGTSELDPQI